MVCRKPMGERHSQNAKLNSITISSPVSYLGNALTFGLYLTYILLGVRAHYKGAKLSKKN
jgi:hypothetical protein